MSRSEIIGSLLSLPPILNIGKLSTFENDNRIFVVFNINIIVLILS